jgi:plasmid stabilization system protein ParE
VIELVLILSADLDIQRMYEFWEACQPARGDLFLSHLDLAFGQLRRHPKSAPVFHRAYRRLMVPGFPLGIIYVAEANRIVVGAVVDVRQDPQSILRRLN